MTPNGPKMMFQSPALFPMFMRIPNVRSQQTGRFPSMMFIHVLVFENNSQIGSLMLKLRLSHRADYIVYFQAHSSKWFISKETAIICENQFGCLKCAKINNIYSKGKDDSEGNDLPQRKDYQIGIVNNCNNWTQFVAINVLIFWP